MKPLRPIRGVVPALALSLNEDGTIDFNGVEKQVTYLVESGVQGLFLNGTTGEGAYLTTSEKIEVLRFVKRLVPGHIDIFAVCHQTSTDAVLREMDEVGELGPDYLSAVTPYYYQVDQDVLVDHFTRIAEAVSIPLIIYNIPQNTGNSIAPETLVALSANQRIAGTKDSSGDFSSFCRVLLSTKQEAFACLQGDDYLDAAALVLGAPAIVTGMGNLRIEPYVRMYKAVEEGDRKTVESCQQEIYHMGEIFACVSDKISAIKTAMALFGRGGRHMKLRSATATDAQAAQVRGILERNGMMS